MPGTSQYFARTRSRSSSCTTTSGTIARLTRYRGNLDVIRSGGGGAWVSTSDDYGRTWSPAAPTEIPCPNSGLDAVRLADGRIVVICNPTHEGRTPLSILASTDNGETWSWRLDLETAPGEYSYPSIVQASDGRGHAVYTYRRTQIRHLALRPDEIGA